MNIDTLTTCIQILVDISDHGTLRELAVRAKESDQPSEIVMSELLYLGENKEQKDQILKEILKITNKLKIKGTIQNFINAIWKYILICKRTKKTS